MDNLKSGQEQPLIKEQDKGKAERSSRSEVAEDEIDLLELWLSIYRRKWLIIIGSLTVAIITAVSSLQTKPKYVSSVLLASVSNEGGISGVAAKYGGLAAMAGISLPSSPGGVSLSKEATITLTSYRFLSEFIAEKGLKKVLYAENWDPVSKKWLLNDSFLQRSIRSIKLTLGVSNSSTASAKFTYEGKEVLANNEPAMQGAVSLFKADILHISEDKNTGFFTLKVKWNDPVQARDWAMELVSRVDNELRDKNILASQNMIDYLKSTLPSIQLQDIRAVALGMIQEQVKKITFAKINPEYVFKVIDPAIVVETPVGPKKGLMISIAFILGTVFFSFIALILNWRDSKKMSTNN